MFRIFFWMRTEMTWCRFMRWYSTKWSYFKQKQVKPGNYLFIFIWVSPLHSTINSKLTHWFIARLEFDVRSKQFFFHLLSVSLCSSRPCFRSSWHTIRSKYDETFSRKWAHGDTSYLVDIVICHSFRSILTVFYLFVAHKVFSR